MVDEIKEDEYHFTDDQGGDVFEEPVEQPSSTQDYMSKITDILSSNNLKRNVLLAIGGFIGLLLVYKIIGGFMSTGGKNRVSKQTQILQPKQALVATKPAPAEKSKPEETAQNQASPVMGNEFADSLAGVKQDSDFTKRKINRINFNILNVEKGISSLGSKLEIVNKSIAMLSQQIKAQQLQIESLKPKPKKKARHKNMQKQRLKYNIQAVIPGRAWLVSNRDTTITVGEGSVIPDYGQVKLIDAEQGIVLMSSGAKFTFRSSDT